MSFWTVHLNPAPSTFDAFDHPVGPSTYTSTRANNEQCEQFTLCEQSEQRTVRTTNSANSSHCANSANNEQCERFILSEQCEQRTVRTVHIVRTVRTANSANSSFFKNRRTGRTVRTGANTVRWSLPTTIRCLVWRHLVAKKIFAKIYFFNF